MIAAVFIAAALFGQAAATPSADPKAASPAPVSGVTGTAKTPEQIKADRLAPDTKVMCHSEVVLGTLFPRKVCTTRQEMRERTGSDQALIRQGQAYNPLSAQVDITK